MELVIDASVTLAWFFEDEVSRYSDRALDIAEQGHAIAPSLWSLEIANAFALAERRGRLNAADVVRFSELLMDLPVEIIHLSPARAFGPVLDLARNYQLSSYDSTYLDLAMQRGADIATNDKAMRRVARRLGVELFA